ncbi:MAG: hypothetical protein ABIQ95_01360 [Bdellovibrionia bacterium]
MKIVLDKNSCWLLAQAMEILASDQGKELRDVVLRDCPNAEESDFAAIASLIKGQGERRSSFIDFNERELQEDKKKCG